MDICTCRKIETNPDACKDCLERNRHTEDAAHFAPKGEIDVFDATLCRHLTNIAYEDVIYQSGIRRN